MISETLHTLWEELKPYGAKLIPVSKTKPNSSILEAYSANNKVFGENKVQELTQKAEELPNDIEWHFIGHLQRNKVKFIAPFVQLIHAVDSLRLLKEINKQAKVYNRVIDCLLQVHIAQEDAKFGFDEKELMNLLKNKEIADLQSIKIIGLMGMATNTTNRNLISTEFKGLKLLFETTKSLTSQSNVEMKELSMGMSGDYKLALEQGSTMVRIGSSIFGARN